MDRFKPAVLAAIVSRAVVAPIAVVTIAFSAVAGSAVAEPPATQVITAVAVGPNGEPFNGYREAPSQGSVTVTDCTTPSPSAVGDDIYYCSPSAAGADTCWPSTPGSLLCLDDPWDKRLHRVTYGGQLPHVQPGAITDPFALLLDDGTRCRLRNGGAWGGRDDGYVGVYGCGAAELKPCGPVAPQPGGRFLYRSLYAGVDSQSRSTRYTKRALSAAPAPHSNHRVVRRRYCAYMSRQKRQSPDGTGVLMGARPAP